MKSHETLDVARDGSILHVRLDRPDVRNAFNGKVVEELQLVFREADLAEDVRVVVLSGNGKSFSAGADLGWMQEQAELEYEANERSAERMARMFLSIGLRDVAVEDAKRARKIGPHSSTAHGGPCPRDRSPGRTPCGRPAPRRHRTESPSPRRGSRSG